MRLITREYGITVEPLYNGQVGARGFVHYLEVSIIGRFNHNNGFFFGFFLTS